MSKFSTIKDVVFGDNSSVKGLLSQKTVRGRFEAILKDRSASYTANLAVMVSSSKQLMQCDPVSIISAAIVSASLNLPLDKNLGYAALVPYNEKQPDGTYLKKAQFQIMWKGLVQLALRSAQYTRIGVVSIFEGQLKSENPLTGDYQFDWNIKSNKVIGFAAYFQLLNGFEKVEYWTVERVQEHGKKYSKTYDQKNSKWKEEFESMGKKTVLKSLLSKWGILSIEMETAVKYDQSVVTEDIQPKYLDNPVTDEDSDVRLTPAHKDWHDAKEALKNNVITLEQLKERYEISDEYLKKLEDEN